MRAIIPVIAGALRVDGAQSAGDTFPGADWQRASSVEALGWAPAKVANLEAQVKALGSSAFMIVTRGQVVAAWGETGRTFLSHSIRKSFMSALYGLAVAERTVASAASAVTSGAPAGA